MATIRRLMTLLKKEGLLEQKSECIRLFTSGRTASAKELTPFELQSLCDTLAENSKDVMDKKRKRVLASIFGLYKLMNKTVTIEYVKAHACRAAKVEDFNKIPSSRLDSIYNAFLKAQKDLQYTGRLVDIHNFEQTTYN
ncbi:hypothetical protein [Chryseobacterium sp.]|uniref:hypothetical protein n=1 Tax=Chryseobacterium sp. TaxID=1871047 RepID=UPI00289F6A56|nr:hypothetical protein [Chryseobacterium sp.]